MAFGRTVTPEKAAEREERDRDRTVVRAQQTQVADAQKAAKQQQAQTDLQAKQAVAADLAFKASPVGRATAARDEGAGFFHVELGMSEVARRAYAGNYQGYNVAERKHGGHSDVLGQIEAVGWRLEDVGYVYVVTGQVSRDKLLSSGQETGVMGKTQGHFLFRRAETAPIA